MDRNRASGVMFFSLIVGVVAGLAATGYWYWRDDELRLGYLSDDLAHSLGASGVVTDGPPIVPFWLLIGAGVLAVMVAVGVGVALWVVTPDASNPPGETDGSRMP